MEHHTGNDIVNIGTGKEITIRDLAITIKSAVEYKGALEFDVTQPDGMPRKLLDSSKLHAMGWRHTIELEEGINRTYEDFLRMLGDKDYVKRF